MSLKSKTLKGAFWSFGELIASKGANFIFQIILARLLSPEAFGILAMVMVVITLGDMLVDSGIASSLIRSKEATEVDFSSVFFMNLALSIFVFLGIYFLAPHIALFYEQPQITHIIRVFSLIIPIKSLMIVQKSILTRKMDFRTQTIIETPSLIISGLIGITLAFYGFGVWSLIYMQIIQAILITLQYWIYNSWRPQIIFSYQVWKKHFVFGYKLTLSYLMDSSYYELYNVLIGKYNSSHILGLYNRAYALQNLPGFIFLRGFNKVALPLFSSIQDDDKRLKSIFIKTVSTMLFAYISLMVILYFNAEQIVLLLFGIDWIEMTDIFKILIIAGVFIPMAGYNYSILVAKGESKSILIGHTIAKIIGLGGVLYFIKHGLYPLLIFLAVSNFIYYLIFMIMASKKINLRIYNNISYIIEIIFLCIPVGIAIDKIMSLMWIEEINWVSNILYIIIFSFSYISLVSVLSYIIKFSPFFYIIDQGKSIINRM